MAAIGTSQNEACFFAVLRIRIGFNADLDPAF
jgi:hypothetical protein